MKSRLLAFAAIFPLIAPTLIAQPAGPSGPTSLGALKGPSGIALVRVFDAPPSLPSGSKLLPIAVPSADVMAAKLISGEYQAAVLPLNMAAKLRSSGLPLSLGAIIGNGMLSLLTSDPKLAALANLRGVELHVAGQGATPDYLIRRLLKEAGLDPNRDLRLAYALPYPEMAAALAAGRIGYALLPEPFATLARQANPALRSPIDLRGLWEKSTGQADYPMTALVFRSELAARPEDARAILDAVRASIEWVKAEPQAASLLVEEHDLGLKAPIAAAAIPRSNYVYLEARAARPAAEALLSAFLETAPASIGGRLPDEGFYASY